MEVDNTSKSSPSSFLNFSIGTFKNTMINGIDEIYIIVNE